ncbi:MAG: RHS repeat-associated core domain-containing protein, partial [Akkermansiaceae bacterium]
LNQIGGSGKTVVEGTLNEAANVSVSGQPAQVASVPGTSDFNFRKEIPVTEGNNNFQITATDSRGNARTQNYSVNVGAAQLTYEYDSNGNLLREKDPAGSVIRAFEWDAADRLKAVNWGSQRVEWTYNGIGQKVLETVNGVASKRFLWDGVELLLEKTATHTITKKFYGDGEQRIGGTDAGNYFYTQDHLGSVREVVNQTGTLQARYDYDSYGKQSVRYQNAAYLGGCTFGYTGHITLPALVAGQSELVLTHYRAYDPQLGRWLSADPLGEVGGINLYGYVGGNPINLLDHLGMEGSPPPVPVPGGGNWKFNSDPNNPRGGSWGPAKPTKGPQSNATYNPTEKYWKVNDGKGNKTWCDLKGNPITKQQAHQNWRQLNPKLRGGGGARMGAFGLGHEIEDIFRRTANGQPAFPLIDWLTGEKDRRERRQRESDELSKPNSSCPKA